MTTAAAGKKNAVRCRAAASRKSALGGAKTVRPVSVSGAPRRSGSNERNTYRALERRQVGRQRGLRVPEFARRAGDAARARYCNEGGQIAQRERHVVISRSFIGISDLRIYIFRSTEL